MFAAPARFKGGSQDFSGSGWVHPEPNFLDVLQAALTHRGLGHSVFPVGRDKRPLARWRPHMYRRSTDRQIGRLFWGRAGAVTGLAVALGSVSGGGPRGDDGPPLCLGCRDFDRFDDYVAWAARHPEWARTLPTVLTARGSHVYFRHRGPVYANFGPGAGDLRCVRGRYAVLPPSCHPSGSHYRWLVCPTPDIPVLPTEQLITLFIPHTSVGQVTRQHTGRPPRPNEGIRKRNILCQPPGLCPGLKALPAAVRDCVLRSVPWGPGQRNHQLFALARRLKPLFPNEHPDALEPAVRAWFVLAHGVIRTKSWALNWSAFWKAWVKVQVPMSESAVLQALRAAAGRATDPRGRLRAAGEAAARLTGGQFFLSCRVAGELAGVSHTRAAQLVHELAAPGGPWVRVAGADKARRRAPEYVLRGGEIRAA